MSASKTIMASRTSAFRRSILASVVAAGACALVSAGYAVGRSDGAEVAGLQNWPGVLMNLACDLTLHERGFISPVRTEAYLSIEAAADFADRLSKGRPAGRCSPVGIEYGRGSQPDSIKVWISYMSPPDLPPDSPLRGHSLLVEVKSGFDSALMSSANPGGLGVRSARVVEQ